MATSLINNGEIDYYGVDLVLEEGLINLGTMAVGQGYISPYGLRSSVLTLGGPLVNLEPNALIDVSFGSTIYAPSVENRSRIRLTNYYSPAGTDTRINTTAFVNYGNIQLDGHSGLATTNGTMSNYGDVTVGPDSFIAVLKDAVTPAPSGTVTTQTLGDYNQYGGTTSVDGDFYCNVNLYGGLLTYQGGSLGFVDFRGPATVTLSYGAGSSAPRAFSGVLAGFAAGDVIDLSSVGYSPGQSLVFQSFDGANQIWNLEDADHNAVSQLRFATAPETAGLMFSDDGTGGTVLSYDSQAARGANFNGGRRGAVLLLDPAVGVVSQWTPQANGDTVLTVAGFAPDSGWSVAGSGDFNGDGTSDVLLRNQNGGVSAFGVWLLQDGVYSSFSSLGGFADNSGWSVLGAGDFNGDHTSDVLLSSDVGGVVQLYDWQVQAGAVANLHSLGMGYSDASGWTTLGTGDFNGDGTSDVLLENMQSLQVGVWTAENGVAKAYTPLGNSSADWIFTGIGDFNGDGKSDILWRDGLTLNIWNVQSNLSVETSQVSKPKPFEWDSDPKASVADFNGDGTSDIYWSLNGQGQYWYMHSDQPGTVLYRSPPLGAADQVVS